MFVLNWWAITWRSDRGTGKQPYSQRLWPAENDHPTIAKRLRSGHVDAAVIGLDTNVLARYLIESGQEVFMPKTVALELEWVLRG